MARDTDESERGRDNERAAPTVDDLFNLDARFRASSSKHDRAVLDDSVARRVAHDETLSVETASNGRNVTVTTTHLQLEARIDAYREELGVVQVSSRETDEQITDDVPPSVLEGIEDVDEAVSNVRARSDYDSALEPPV